MVTKRKIAIACDHAGFFLKEKILIYLRDKYEVKDFGTFSDEPVDYADFGHPVAEAISEGRYEFGITICGTGNGMNMTANKHNRIRSALCWNEEISRLAREHNDANICALPGRHITESEAYLIVKTFLESSFEGGRHKPRIDKIPLKTY